jgi:hypothetical protein
VLDFKIKIDNLDLTKSTSLKKNKNTRQEKKHLKKKIQRNIMTKEKEMMKKKMKSLTKISKIS